MAPATLEKPRARWGKFWGGGRRERGVTGGSHLIPRTHSCTGIRFGGLLSCLLSKSGLPQPPPAHNDHPTPDRDANGSLLPLPPPPRGESPGISPTRAGQSCCCPSAGETEAWQGRRVSPIKAGLWGWWVGTGAKGNPSDTTMKSRGTQCSNPPAPAAPRQRHQLPQAHRSGCRINKD